MSTYRSKYDPQYLEWRKAVLKRDQYRCQICGAKNRRLDCHHRNSYDWAVSQRYDVDNGVVLCGGRTGCHSLFHRLYGKGNNTVGQYMQFYMQYRGREPVVNRRDNAIKSKKLKRKLLKLEQEDLLEDEQNKEE